MNHHDNKSPFNSQDFISLDQLGRAGEQLRRNRQADFLSGLKVDDEIELHRLFDRKVGRFCSLENPVHVLCYAPVAVRDVRPVVHEPTGIYIFTSEVHRRQPAL